MCFLIWSNECKLGLNDTVKFWRDWDSAQSNGSYLAFVDIKPIIFSVFSTTVAFYYMSDKITRIRHWLTDVYPWVSSFQLIYQIFDLYNVTINWQEDFVLRGREDKVKYSAKMSVGELLFSPIPDDLLQVPALCGIFLICEFPTRKKLSVFHGFVVSHKIVSLFFDSLVPTYNFYMTYRLGMKGY